MRPVGERGQGQGGEAEGLDGGADAEHPAAPAADQAGAGERGGEVAGGHRDERPPGRDRAEPEALLQGDGDDEHEAAEAREVGEGDAQAAPHLGDAQQGRRHQRGAAALLGAALDDGEGGGQDGEQAEQHPGPERPAGGAALHQRDEQGEQGGGEQDGAGHVDPGGPGGTALRDVAERRHHGEQCERHVEQEDRAPAGAEQVGGNEHPAEHLADHDRDAADRAVDAERAAAGGALGGGGDGAEHLRDQQRGRGALGGPGGDQGPRVGGEAAGQRGEGERGGADHEQSAAAEDVAEAPAEDEQHGEGDAVAGGDQFEDGGPGGQVLVDGRQGDVDDEEVEHRQEGPEQDGDQPGGAEGGAAGGGAVVGGGGADGRGGGGELSGHGSYDPLRRTRVPE